MICLLCSSPAVADGLCVPCGAKLSVAKWVLKGASRDWIRRTTGGTIELIHASAGIDTSAKALAFLDRLEAARAERKRAEDELIAKEARLEARYRKECGE